VYLKSLTLKGFKSFAQPTTFAFETGVTCVVGPNGSGKSNVVDALAWVMGEQGAKTLRGGKMEDVIFAGTATRGPLGRAEVVLTIDNSDGALPIEYSEVTIGRTLFRNGGSEYAINGQSCRLLDVQELLSDSGLGREMHVIVGQGQLDAVLRASPEERRGFIEEAAGILKHRRRKEKTIRKLDAMQANLTRLSDLAGEIRRQLKPLGHQAEIAREAQTIAAVVRDARARLLADDVVAARNELTSLARSESERKTQRIVLQEQLDQAKLREHRIEQLMVGDAVDRARRTAFALESAQERLRGLYSLANQRIALLSQQDDSPGIASTVTPAMVQEAVDEAGRMRAAVTEAEADAEKAAARTVTARIALDALDEEISAQSALVSRHDLEVARLAAQLDVAKSRLAAARGELLRQQNAVDQAHARRDATRAEHAAIETEARSAVEADGSLEELVALAEEHVVTIQEQLDARRDQVHALERERDALAARTSALSMALDRRDGGASLSGAAGIRGLVAEHVKVAGGYETAIAAALGSLGDALLADTAHDALAALDSAAANDAGRVELVVADAPSPTPGADFDGLTSAVSVVTAPAGILGLLGAVWIADDLAAARAAWPRIAAAENATVVTRAGDVLTRYVLRGGTGAQRSRLELAAERDSAATKLDTVRTEFERMRGSLAESRQALDEVKQDAVTARAALRSQESEHAARTARLSRARAALDASEAEFVRLTAALDLAKTAESAAVSGVEHAKSERDAYASTPRPMLDASSRDGLLYELDEARAVEMESRIRVETARERVRAEDSRATALRRRRDAEQAAAEEHARVMVIRRRQIAAATLVAEALPAVLDSAGRSVAEARVTLAAAEAARSEQNAELADLRANESSLRASFTELNDLVHSVEMQVYERKLHLSTLLERAGAELGLVEDVLVAEYGPHTPVPDDAFVASPSAPSRPVPASSGIHAIGAGAGAGAGTEADARDRRDGASELPAGTPFVRAEQEARLARAERTLGQLGRVNPLALEEFAALEQRHKFLTEQLTDLTNTRRDLLTIIDEIDEKMQDIFGSAFDDTRDAFNAVFPVLFPGGTGSLHLTDPDNLLTTGIEVTVRPAGKKIERLSLLSGGERSLAAVALLIAIFKARPSPFYIMDEVEAALDDANLGRLLEIFEDLRETSQLIVITHQKRTMEIADALYGVSMRQDGVSAVVGQRVESSRAVKAS